MRRFYHIFKKEFKAYFVSPIAYIVIAIFLLITGWFFFSTFFLFRQASLRNFFTMLPVIFSFVVPAVTMRLFSEEQHIGSYETLLTLPLNHIDVIMGKFFAAVIFIGAMLVPTLAYPFCISFLGDLDWGPVIGGYAGAMLLGAAFAGIGLLASAVTRNQIVAFIIGMAICFSLTLIDRMLILLPTTTLSIFHYIGVGSHFENISKGILDSRDILYFISLCFLGLYGTRMVLREKY